MEYAAELQDYIDTLMVRDGSDIHIIAGTKPLFRVQRELVPFIQKEVLTETDTQEFFRVIAGSRVEHAEGMLQEQRHLMFSYIHTTKNDVKVNLRVTVYYEMGNIALTLRLVQASERTLEELHLPAMLKEVMHEPNGLFLIVGATGNGKSTALAAMVGHCNNTLRKHILTIEDPIEFVFNDRKSTITQQEIPWDALSFRSALDTALRTDADILMIGEMREVETMRAVMTAAEVGHLALSTVHANSAYGAIHRIIDSFHADQQRQIAHQLAGSLLGVCSVRLLPRMSGGLIPACEILINTDAVGNLIREGRVESIKSTIQTGKEEGMISLERYLADLVKRGEVALEVATLHASSEQALSRYL
ncbi:MAG: PilT/PilU family type 4a pilus ATPase [Candidatus Kaiserbacteria bacterium]|nr:PilT/PilU family type 4a pilus ATPase [Candidatus Kaiserbacteria bacterium]